MASRSIGSIYASLYLRDKDFSKGLKKARSDASSFNSTIASLGKKGLAAAGLSSPFVTMGAAIKSAIDQGGALQDMMTRTGAAGEGLVIMQTAFQNAGLAAEMVPDALNKMQKALAGVNEDGDQTAGVFAQLGLSAEALTAMDPAKAFEAIARAISNIKDPATRTARAMEVFGKSGGKALAVLNDPDAFTLAITQVGGLGKTLADNAGSLDKIGDSMSALQTKVSQLAVGFTVGLIPALDATSDSFNKLDLTEIGKAFGEYTYILVSFADSLKGVTSPLEGFIAAYAAFKALTGDSKGTELPSNFTIGADGKLYKDKPQGQNGSDINRPTGIERGPATGDTSQETIDSITKAQCVRAVCIDHGNRAICIKPPKTFLSIKFAIVLSQGAFVFKSRRGTNRHETTPTLGEQLVQLWYGGDSHPRVWVRIPPHWVASMVPQPTGVRVAAPAATTSIPIGMTIVPVPLGDAGLVLLV